MEKRRKSSKKLPMIDTGDYLKKKIIRQGNMQEIDICLKKTNRNREKCIEKVYSAQCMEKIRTGHKKWFVTDTGDYLKKKKNKAREYARSRYHNVSKAEKQKENISKSSLRYVSTRERLSLCLFRSNSTRLSV